MSITVVNWFLGIFSILLWVLMFVVYEKHRVIQWLDNKFGPDDPMPPNPEDFLKEKINSTQVNLSTLTKKNISIKK